MHSGLKFSFVFGKRRPGGQGSLRTRLEIRYAPENVVHHFWKNSREFHRSLKNYVAKWPKETRDDTPVTTSNEVKDHSEWANFDYMAHAGTEGMIDFYQLPPSGIARFMQGQGTQGLTIEPVVRVMLTSSELLRLLDKVNSMIVEMMGFLPQEDQPRLREMLEGESLKEGETNEPLH